MIFTTNMTILHPHCFIPVFYQGSQWYRDLLLEYPKTNVSLHYIVPTIFFLLFNLYFTLNPYIWFTGILLQRIYEASSIVCMWYLLFTHVTSLSCKYKSMLVPCYLTGFHGLLTRQALSKANDKVEGKQWPSCICFAMKMFEICVSTYVQAVWFAIQRGKRVKKQWEHKKIGHREAMSTCRERCTATKVTGHISLF